MEPVIRYKVPCGHICGQPESKPELVMMMNPIDLVLSFSACPQMGMKIDYLRYRGHFALTLRWKKRSRYSLLPTASYSMPVHPCSDPRLLEVRIADYRCKGGLYRLRAFCLHDVGTYLLQRS